MTLFETKGLAIGYQDDLVLQEDINISLHSGEIITLMGQNGVGKTTFLKTISKLLPKLKGDILYQKESLEEISNFDLSKRLGLVLTERPSAGNLTVSELVATGRHPYSNWLGTLTHSDYEVMDWAMTQTNTNYLSKKKLAQLSDGQLQKVMIARALAQETAMIFLDEPTAHLDLHNKIEIMLLLKQIADQGKGILISTHDLQISTQLSDKMWLFDFNNPVIEGIPEDLILDGSIKKTLFLEEYDYDFKNGRFSNPNNLHHKTIALEGEEEKVYWTRQALHRVGFTIDQSSPARIIANESGWELHNTVFTSIQSLLKELA